MIKIFAIGMLLSFVQLTAHAMEYEYATLSELSSKKPVYLRLEEFKKEDRPVALIFGAVPSEEDHFNFSDLSNAGVFYLNNVPKRYETDETATKDWIGKIILGDFNRMPFRMINFGQFAKQLDLIIPDVNVAYFMQLDKSFLRDFAETLKVGGKMLLDYNSHVGGDDYSKPKNEINATFSDEYLSSTSVGQKRNYEYGKGLETNPGNAPITLGNLYDSDVPRLMVKAKLFFSGGQPTEDLYREIDAQYDIYLTEWATKHAPNCTIKLMNGVFPYRQNTNYGGDLAAPINYLEITRTSDWSWQENLG